MKYGEHVCFCFKRETTQFLFLKLPYIKNARTNRTRKKYMLLILTFNASKILCNKNDTPYIPLKRQ